MTFWSCTLRKGHNGIEANRIKQRYREHCRNAGLFLYTKIREEDLSMNFGEALEALKAGKRLRRAGWNGKGMFVVYQKGYPQGIPCNKQTAEAWGMNEGELFVCNPYLQIKNVDGSHSMWVPSIGDCLAEDWEVVA